MVAAYSGGNHKFKTAMMRYLLLLSALTLFFISCAKKQHTNESVESAMQQYDRLIKKMDADSISLLFAPDGDLGSIAHGRDSIRNFLASFKNVRVLDISSVSSSIRINSDTALQEGSYHQLALVNGKDTFNLHGTFKASWIWSDKEGWRIKRMETTPAK